MVVEVGELFNKIGNKLSFLLDEKASDEFNTTEKVKGKKGKNHKNHNNHSNNSIEFVSNIFVEGEVLNDDGHRYIINGDGHVTISLPCSRCINPVELYLEFSLDDELFTFCNNSDEENSNLKKSEDESEFFSGNSIDLLPVIKRSIISSLPMKTLCKDDCKGLCFMCGQDLNHKECNCDTHDYDPRLESLRTLFNNSNEEV